MKVPHSSSGSHNKNLSNPFSSRMNCNYLNYFWWFKTISPIIFPYINHICIPISKKTWFKRCQKMLKDVEIIQNPFQRWWKFRLINQWQLLPLAEEIPPSTSGQRPSAATETTQAVGCLSGSGEMGKRYQANTPMAMLIVVSVMHLLV